MEKIVLKSIALENAVSKLRSKVVSMQTAVNQAASVEEVSKHYSCITFECQVIGQMLADVRRSCFNVAAKYNYEWEQ